MLIFSFSFFCLLIRRQVLRRMVRDRPDVLIPQITRICSIVLKTLEAAADKEACQKVEKEKEKEKGKEKEK